MPKPRFLSRPRRPGRPRRMRTSVVVTIVFGAIALVPPMLATAQYVAYRSDDGLHGCVARSHELFTRSVDVDSCIVERAAAMIEQDGVRDAFAAVEVAASKDPVFLSRCHVPFHELGRRARRAGDGVEVLRQARADTTLPNACSKGFVHGYVQQLGGEDGVTAPEVVGASRVLCDGMAGGEREVCMHAIGHGAARAAGNDLARAGDACRLLDTAGDHYHCTRGAVMELQMASDVYADRLEPDTDMGAPRAVRCGSMHNSLRDSCNDQVKSFLTLGSAFRVGLA